MISSWMGNTVEMSQLPQNIRAGIEPGTQNFIPDHQLSQGRMPMLMGRFRNIPLGILYNHRTSNCLDGDSWWHSDRRVIPLERA